MVSLQAEGNFWFHYDEELPSDNDYVSAYLPNQQSSYPFLMVQDSIGDPPVEEIIRLHADPSFYESYLSYPKRFSKNDSYSLFVPLAQENSDESEFKVAISLEKKDGYSFQDREIRTFGKIISETQLKQSMCSVRIQPFQLQDKHTSISTLYKDHSFLIDPNGVFDGNKQIVSYKIFPHATLFFYKTNTI